MSAERRLRLDFPATAPRGTEIVLGDGVLGRLGELAAAHAQPGACAVLTDAHVAATPHADRAESSLRAAGFRPFRVTLPAGEAAKDLARAADVWQRFAAEGLDRAGLVCAVGGGAVGDAAAFCAALWMRGVPVVHAPTTLLAMADSAVGGKTAVNLPAGKNLIGVVAQPALVVADVATLATLPDRELRSGFAEVVKCAVLADRARIGALRDAAASLRRGDAAGRADAVEFAVRVKIDHVRDDPDDTRGVRALLNLGHTVAHALEAATGYGAMLHGEAVSVGLVVAARIGARRGACEASLPDEVAAALGAFGLPTTVPPGVTADDLVARTRLDKKRAAGVRRMVLPAAGSGAALAPVDDAELRAALAD